MSQRVPAWKRLGLKLKSAGEGDSPAVVGAGAGPGVAAAPSPAGKRKEPPSSAVAAATATPAKRQKSVSFAAGQADKEAGATAPKTPKKAKVKKAKKPKAKKEGAIEEARPSLEREIEYLRQWQTARSAWKFNKNHQNLLIKYVLAGSDLLPATHMDAFYDYIRDVQGAVRTRLRDEAAAICAADENEADAAKNKADENKADEAKSKAEPNPEAKPPQKAAATLSADAVAAYERIVADMRAQLPQRISEAERVPQVAEPALQQRLRRRIRAENVVAVLAEAGPAAAATVTAAPASAATLPTQPTQPTQLAGEKRATRNRKKRVTAESDSESSDSSSDSDSDSDSDE